MAFLTCTVQRIKICYLWFRITRCFLLNSRTQHKSTVSLNRPWNARDLRSLNPDAVYSKANARCCANLNTAVLLLLLASTVLFLRHSPDLTHFTAIVDLSRFNNSCLKSPASTLVDLTFQSRALRSFSLSQLRSLSL